MAGPNAPYTNLDEKQVLRQAFDESTDRLRVDAEVTATIGELDVQIDGTGPTPSSIQITDGTDTLQINSDGTINVNVSVDAADGDNILGVGTEDGLFNGIQHPLKITSDGNLNVKDSLTQAILTSIDNKLTENTRTAILNANDTVETITTLSFGTSNERIDKIEYNSALFGSTIVRKQFTYTPVGGKYQLVTITWSIV